ncbi:MAG: Carbon storage regulator [Firmicutes bacterium]|nr:Carbon storage regulator [Bacillota bacterium]
MLILTRRVGESVVIGDGIELRVMNVQGSQVRLGITAPPELTILRSELIGKERKEKARVDD